MTHELPARTPLGAPVSAATEDDIASAQVLNCLGEIGLSLYDGGHPGVTAQPFAARAARVAILEHEAPARMTSHTSSEHMSESFDIAGLNLTDLDRGDFAERRHAPSDMEFAGGPGVHEQIQSRVDDCYRLISSVASQNDRIIRMLVNLQQEVMSLRNARRR